MLAIVFTSILVGGVGGYIAYDRLWANNPAWNAAVDQSFASKAVDAILLICSTGGNDNLVYEPYNFTFWDVLGVRNRSGFAMDTKWTFSYDDLAVGVTLSSTRVFHLPGSGDAYPKFQWTMNSTQLAKARIDPNPSHNLVVSVLQIFNVTGFHGTYQFTRDDSGTQAAQTGLFAITLPSCLNSAVSR